MQRDVIEHPDYIPKKVLAGLDLRAGAERGRIYRITPKGAARAGRSVPGGWSSAELVPRLADGNQWWRMTAQRLLVERRERSESLLGALRALSRGASAHGRLHALWYDRRACF